MCWFCQPSMAINNSCNILFTGTLGFLLVLFDNTSNGISMSVTIQENNNENASCQYSTASSFGQ